MTGAVEFDLHQASQLPNEGRPLVEVAVSGSAAFASTTRQAATLFADGKHAAGRLYSAHTVAVAKGTMNMLTIAKGSIAAAMMVAATVVTDGAAVAQLVVQSEAAAKIPEPAGQEFTVAAKGPRADGDQRQWRQVAWPKRVAPQLDEQPFVRVYWDGDMLKRLPVKWKGEVMGGTEEQYRHMQLEKWVTEQQIDWSKQMLIVALPGYRVMKSGFMLQDVTRTAEAVRMDLEQVGNIPDEGQAPAWVFVIAPRHRKVLFYIDGKRYGQNENGLLPR